MGSIRYILKHTNEQEKNLLKSIVTFPISVFIFFSIIIISVVVKNNLKQGEDELNQIKKTYVLRQKELVKNEVLKVVNFIKLEKKHAKETLKKNIKQHVDIAHVIATSIYNQNKSKSKAVIIEMIKDTLRGVRFNEGRGYFFIYSMDFKNILLPIAPQLEGSDFSNYHDIHQNYVVRNIVNILKKQESTFYTWFWHKPQDKFKHYEKIGYSKYFEPLDWYIGTGEYIIDFEKSLQKKILEQIQGIRYGKNGYIFTYKYNGQCLTHIKKELVGKNRLEEKDKDGIEVVKEVIKIGKNGSGYITYTATINPLTKKPARKVSYVSGIDEWRWIVGAGAYIDDIEVDLKNKEALLKEKSDSNTIELIFIIVIANVILILFLLWIARRSKKQFSLYKNALLDEVAKNEKHLVRIQQQAKLASMGEMIRNIAHQWRQPLNTLSISIGTMILLKEDNKLTKKTMLSTFDRMEKNILHLSDTISVFTDFFKPDGNKKEFSVKDAINETILIIKDSFAHNFIELNLNCESSATLKGNLKELQQIIITLLNNSKDAIISNKTKKGKVSIYCKEIEDKICISILDNGGGIKEEIQDKVFEPYFSTKFKDEGAGVGLYIAKISLESHFNGTLEFKNKDEGVVFTILIDK